MVEQNKVWLFSLRLSRRSLSGHPAKRRRYILARLLSLFFVLQDSRSGRGRKAKCGENTGGGSHSNDTCSYEDLTPFVHQGSSFTFKEEAAREAAAILSAFILSSIRVLVLE